VTDAVAVGLNFDHVKLLNAAAVADMDRSCCSFHTNSPKIPESGAAAGRANQVPYAAYLVKTAITAVGK
jgi:hypothetical protein